MTVNREQKPNLYALGTAEAVTKPHVVPRLTRLEQAIQDQKILIKMLRGKEVGNRPPGPVLKNDGDAAGAPHSTVEKIISNRSEDTTVEKNSVLTNSLRILAEESKNTATPP
jgi:hypothetical protein